MSASAFIACHRFILSRSNAYIALPDDCGGPYPSQSVGDAVEFDAWTAPGMPVTVFIGSAGESLKPCILNRHIARFM